MKKIFLIFLAGLLILSNLPVIASANDDITVVVNGEELVFDVPATTVKVYDEEGKYTDDRIMLPIRAISEKLNFDVAWNEATKGIDIYRNNHLIMMWIDTPNAFKLKAYGLDKMYTMDAPPTIIDGRTMVPIQAVAELLGAEVNWNGETKTVDIKYEIGTIEDNSGVAKESYIFGEMMNMLYDVYSGYMNKTLKGVSGKIILENDKEMEFKVYPEIAPLTATNFVTLAKEGFYKNTTFHRVIKDFVAQGGGYDVGGEHKDASYVRGEFILNGIFNLIPHKRGVMSLARPTHPDMGSSEFFICHQDTLYLDGSYAAFGEITSGFDVLDEICSATTDETDKPLENIVVKDIIIYE